jgi:glycosyltransferase involved in cell wall biosynthesis
MDRPPVVWAFSDAPYAGGAERYLQWILFAAGPSRMGLVVVDRPELASWISLIEERGFVVDRIPAGSLVAQWVAFFRWARSRRPRVLHVNMPGPNDGLFAVAPLLAKFARVERVVVTEHLPSVGRIGRRGLLKRLTVGAVDRAITVCQAHQSVMAREFGYSERQLVAIENGIADPGLESAERTALPADLALTDPPGRLRIVQVGTLDPRKGGERLLRAFATARPDASLWFIGEGPAHHDLASSAAEMAIDDRVVFTGQRSDLPRLLSAFDLVVLASEREGMPYVLIEAMAMARPILATDVDGVGELVESTVNGILVGPDDAIGLARELGELCRDRGRLQAMGRAGRQKFEDGFRLERALAHTWQQYGEEASAWPTDIVSS